MHIVNSGTDHPERPRLHLEGKKAALRVLDGGRTHRHHGHKRAFRAAEVKISDEARGRLEAARERRVGGKEIEIPAAWDRGAFLKGLLSGALAGKEINVIEAAPIGKGAFPPPSVVQAEPASFSADVESFSFSASGTIRTEDGASLSFTIELSLQRASLEGLALPGGPLTVNYGGVSEDLTSMRFSFEIAQEDGASTAPGSGLFAIDSSKTGKEGLATEGPGAAPDALGLEGTDDIFSESFFDLASKVFGSFGKASFSSVCLEYSRQTLSVENGSAPIMSLAA